MDSFPLKLIEVIVLAAVVFGFGWWQLRDVKRAQRESAARRAAQEQTERESRGVATQESGSTQDPADRSRGP